jgi:hypothetical protein
MTPYEMGTLVRNINIRAARIEQILTTLATKEELLDGMNRLEARIDEARHAHRGAIEEELRSSSLTDH